MDRRRAAILSVICLLATMIAGIASAARDQPAARAASQWLAKQLAPDGTLQNPNGGTLPDHGLMIDALFAMYASGDGALATPIVEHLAAHSTDYFTWDGLIPGQGYEAVIVGGAAAKVLVAAEVAGRDPRDFGGHDMVAETKGAIMRSGVDKGRVSDYSKDPDLADQVSNNANMFGQALAVIGLAAVGENDQLAIDTMLTQQCSEGYFRIFFGYLPSGERFSTCDEGKALDQSTPDGDTTGLALSAMLAAREAGAPGLDGPIGKAVGWLTANQTASGGWGGGVGTEAPNTNSTGLITQALASAGSADAAVDRGVAFLKAAQVSPADSGTALAAHIGAIAYNPAAYQEARTGGLSGIHTWLRAGAQAALGLSQVGFRDLTLGKLPAPEAPPTTTTVPAPGNPVPPPRAPVRTVALPPVTKTQPAITTPAARLGAYLANHLVGGDHVEVTEDGKTYVDYDATADLVLALRALGEQPDAVGRASAFLLNPESIKAYAHGAPYEQDAASYAEPLAKLLIVASFTGADDIAGELRTDLKALRSDDGKFTDTGTYADADNSVRRHAWAVLATGSPVDLLVARQCKDGTFPADLNTGDCGAGDLAATAAAVVALAVSEGRSEQALVKAAAVLTAKTDDKGMVSSEAVLSATVAAARQVAGLDASETARSLGSLVRDDGGLGDFATSLAVAQGVAGRSWVSAPGSPLSATVRLPLVAPKEEATRQATAGSGSPRVWLLLMVLGGVLLGLALGRVITRNKGVAQ